MPELWPIRPGSKQLASTVLGINTMHSNSITSMHSIRSLFSTVSYSYSLFNVHWSTMWITRAQAQRQKKTLPCISISSLNAFMGPICWVKPSFWSLSCNMKSFQINRSLAVRCYISSLRCVQNLEESQPLEHFYSKFAFLNAQIGVPVWYHTYSIIERRSFSRLISSLGVLTTGIN